MVMDSSPTSADAVANGSGGGINSPQSRRRTVWASVVRGDSEQNSSPTAAAAAASGASPGSSSSPPVEEASASDNTLIESSGLEAQPESSENNGDNNAGGPRRHPWNRMQNGVVEPASVMGGAVSWPALSETTRPIPRSLSDASRPVSDGSAPSSQVNVPIISQTPQRSANSNAHVNHHGNHGNTVGNHQNSARLRSRNRGGGGGGGGGSGSGGSSGGGVIGGGSSSGGQSQGMYNQPMPPPFPVVYDLPFGIMPLDNPVRGPRPGAQSPTGSDHSSQRNNSRRSNYGPRPRGDGQYHNNPNHGRRDQDRREVHHPPQFAPPPAMGYMPPPLPPGAAPFMTPPPMRVFPGHMGYDMGSPFIYVPPLPPDSFRAMPIVSPLPPMIFPPANENLLTNMIVKQIDFYFSDDNLVKDSFLRSKMDDQGWVPLSLIASFRRVQQLTKDIAIILESLRFSLVVEVHGDKVRRRNEWSKWLLSTGVVNSDPASSTSSSAPENVLATSLQEVSLDDAVAHVNGIVEASAGHTEMAAAQSPVELANGDNAEEEEEEEEVHSNSL